MRQNELQQGIDVYDDKGNTVGTSKAAAKKVTMCYSSAPRMRVFRFSFVYFLPKIKRGTNLYQWHCMAILPLNKPSFS